MVKDDFDTLRSMSKKEKVVRWGQLSFIGLFLLLMAASLLYFRNTFFFAWTGMMYRKRVVLYLLPSLLSAVAVLFAPAKRRRWKYGRVIYMLLAIFLSSVMFQHMTWNDHSVWKEPVYAALSISITAIIHMVVWAFVWDARIAAIATYVLLLVSGYAYECVYLFRGIAFKPMDIFSVGTAVSVLSGYDFTLEVRHVFWVSVGVLLCALAGWTENGRKCTMRAKVGKGICLASAIAWGFILLYTPLLPVLHVSTTAFESDAPLVNGMQGTLTTLMMELYQLRSNRPTDYNASELSEMDKTLLEFGTAGGSSEKPNVIVIMNESLADLTSLWELEVSPDPLAYIHSLKANTIHGNLYVSAYGGATCNTEHSFLTGTAPAPALEMPLLATVLEDTPSLAWQMKANDYTTIAMHPHFAANYQRETVYPRLGFDFFLHAEHFKEAERWRFCVRDEDCYRKIISLFEEKNENEKLFIFNVTLQNHGGYLTGEVPKQLELNTEYEDPVLQEYLDLIYVSDQALKELIDYFEQQDEPTVILFFGDHQPNLDMSTYVKREGLTAMEQSLTQYITPFFIWSNTGELQPEYVEALSVNYLAAYLMKKVDLPMTAYDRWVLETAEDYPVTVISGYGHADGTFTAWGENQERPERLVQMDWLRYNRLYDSDKRLPALDLQTKSLSKDEEKNDH